MKRIRFSPKTWLLSAAAGAALTPGFVLLSHLQAADSIDQAAPNTQAPRLDPAEEQLQAAVQRELTALYEQQEQQRNGFRVTARSLLNGLKEKGRSVLEFRPHLPRLGRIAAPSHHRAELPAGVPKPSKRRLVGRAAEGEPATETAETQTADSRSTVPGPALRHRPPRFLDRMRQRHTAATVTDTHEAAAASSATPDAAPAMPRPAAPDADISTGETHSGAGSEPSAIERELQELYGRHGMQAPSLDPRIALERLKQSVQPPAHQVVVPDRRAPHSSGSIVGRFLPKPQSGHRDHAPADTAEEPIVIRKPIRLVDLLGIPHEPPRSPAKPGPAQPPIPDDLAETIADQVVAKLQQTPVASQVAGQSSPATPIQPVPETAGELPAVQAASAAQAAPKPLRLTSETSSTERPADDSTSPAPRPTPELPVPERSHEPNRLETPPALQPADEPALQTAEPEAEQPADAQLDPQTREKLQRIAERRNRAGLKGFCPVALRDARELRDAQLQFHSTYRGKTYFFSSAEAKAKFDADPAAYAPAYDGLDVVLLKTRQQKRLGVLDYAVWYHNRLYLFASPESMAAFTANPSQFAVDEQASGAEE